MLTRCIFCDIISGKADGLIITENEHALAVLDAFPLVSGHTLILSKKHCEKVQDLNQNELVSLVNLLSKVTSAVESGAQANSTLIAIHNGKVKKYLIYIFMLFHGRWATVEVPFTRAFVTVALTEI